MDSLVVKSCYLKGTCFSSSVRGSERSVLNLMVKVVAGLPWLGRLPLTIGSILVCLPLKQSPELNQEHVASRDYSGLSLREGFKIRSWL